jgi:uncharacterized protein YecE (DUF72 family)
MISPTIHIGCAGWNIPKEYVGKFPGEGTHLERYARIFPAVEINSSFYRSHKPSTYERWAKSVPEKFRFSVKVPRLITHTRRLRDADAALTAFLAECAQLGANLGLLLVQLPPSLRYDMDTADRFFTVLRRHFDGDVACEPRHPTWCAPEPDNLLASFRVARVAAHPSILTTISAADGVQGISNPNIEDLTTLPEPGGWSGLVYYRLHGAPRIYYSSYPDTLLKALSSSLAYAASREARVWCIFDNTAEGAAAENALAIMNMLGHTMEP